jgi:hypothetical protein
VAQQLLGGATAGAGLTLQAGATRSRDEASGQAGAVSEDVTLAVTAAAGLREQGQQQQGSAKAGPREGLLSEELAEQLHSLTAHLALHLHGSWLAPGTARASSGSHKGRRESGAPEQPSKQSRSLLGSSLWGFGSRSHQHSHRQQKTMAQQAALQQQQEQAQLNQLVLQLAYAYLKAASPAFREATEQLHKARKVGAARPCWCQPTSASTLA